MTAIETKSPVSVKAASIPEQEMEAARRGLSKLMFWMFREFPFWGFLVEKFDLHMLPPDNPYVRTAGVSYDGHIYFNYGFWNSLDMRGKAFLLAHEIMHPLLGHNVRRQNRDRKIWNVAADILINHMLVDHFGGPHNLRRLIDQGMYWDPQQCQALKVDLDAMTAEMVYEMLVKECEKGKGGKEGKGQGKAGAPGPGGGSRDGQDDEKEGGGQGAGQQDGIGNDILEGGDPVPQGGQSLKGRTEEVPNKENGGWNEAAAQAATRAKLQGRLPAHMERVVGKLLKPQVRWEQALAYCMRSKYCTKVKGRSTFVPPSRRHLWQDILLPSRRAGKVPSVAFSIDTSGSMSDEEILKGLSEFDGVRKLYGLATYLIECDAEVSGTRWVGPYEDIPEVTGGGGTSFVPVMRHISEMEHDRPDVLVYFTDGFGEFGNAPPDFEVIWVINSQVVAPYGTTIHVKG